MKITSVKKVFIIDTRSTNMTIPPDERNTKLLQSTENNEPMSRCDQDWTKFPLEKSVNKNYEKMKKMVVLITENKTGTSQVGAIIKAQKAQTFWNCKRGTFGFLKKKKNRKIRILSQSHSAEKLERGALWAFWNFNLLQNIKKLEGGDPLETKKNFEKKSHSAEKNSNPIVSSCFVFYDKNGVTEKGTLCTILNVLPVCLCRSTVQ